MNERTKKSRKWMSFSLRTALVLLTCLGVWLGWFVPRVQKQRQAADRVRSLGGTLCYSFHLDTAWNLDIDAVPGLPKWLVSALGIDWFYSIRLLNIEDQPVGDIKHLSSLHDLRSLTLVKCEIPDLAPLRNLTRLERLAAGINPIDDISVLANLKNLKVLYLFKTEIHDIEPLRGLPKLEFVDLRNTMITDVSPLADHQKMTFLNISNTRVVDILPLGSCKALANLYLRQTNIPDADIETLQELLPNCKINR